MPFGFQVKEKFGSLRYYFESSSAVNDDVRWQMVEVVSAAELEAAITCETCGSRKKVALRQGRLPHKRLCGICVERDGYNRFVPNGQGTSSINSH